MSFEVSLESIDVAQPDAMYLRRRVQEEAAAAASADSLAATLIHVELATAYARRCRDEDDLASVAKHRLW